jgi:hypothetical protein
VKLNCYCCGEPLGAAIALVTTSNLPVDRVFVLNPEHLERIDDESTHSVLVTVQA